MAARDAIPESTVADTRGGSSAGGPATAPPLGRDIAEAKRRASSLRRAKTGDWPL
jgi:hypothetical protein